MAIATDIRVCIHRQARSETTGPGVRCACCGRVVNQAAHRSILQGARCAACCIDRRCRRHPAPTHAVCTW